MSRGEGRKVVFYVVGLVLVIAIFAVGLVFMKQMVKYHRFFDVDLPCLIFILYFIELVLLVRDVGFDGWSFLNALPTGNLGPFVFFIVPLLLLLPKRARRYAHTIIALLAPVMLMSGLLSGILFLAAGKQFYNNYIFDMLCHALCALYGVYLVRRDLADLGVRRCLISGGILFVVPVVMLVLNAILHTSFFGLSVYGEHTIYNVIYLKSAALSIILYFVGMALSLVIGYFFQKYLLFAHDVLATSDDPSDEEDV